MTKNEFIKKYHWITSPILHKSLVAIVFFMVVFGMWFGAEKLWLDNLNVNIVSPYLFHITSNIYLTLSCFVLTLVLFIAFVYRYIIRYQYRLSVVCVVFVTAILMGYYRFISTGFYEYLAPFNNEFKYIDFVLIWLCLYMLAAIVNYWVIKNSKLQTLTKQNEVINTRVARRLENELIIPLLQSDSPIQSVESDILDYADEVDKLAQEISNLSLSRSWSIAISAPWGAGKTSFMNLLKQKFLKENYEQIDFTPRRSKTAKSIQGDFFNQLVNLISKTDVRVKNSMQSYLEMLGIIDNTGLLSKLTHSTLFKEEESKQSLTDIFSQYPKRIIAYIEDFDRLTRSEIIEVLKLLDNNAAFPNIIFITAYDKDNVNAIVHRGKVFKTTPFVDKFFDFEYTLPKRPYKYIMIYLRGLFSQIIDNENHRAVLNDVFDENKLDFDWYLQPCISTLRDAKRFYNLFATDYAHLQEDVIFKEFLLVELLKYRYIDVYHNLYSHVYLVQADVTWELKDNIMVNDIAKRILTELFTTKELNEYGEEIGHEDPYRHIYDIAYFDNYFINGIYGYLRIKDMRKTIADGLEMSKEVVDNWFEDGIKRADYCLFLDSLISEEQKSKEQFLNFATIFLYVVIRHKGKMLSWSKDAFIKKPYVQERLNKLGIPEGEYMSHLLQSINDVTWDPLMTFQRSLLSEIINDKDANEYYITYSDIFPTIKRQFRIILDDNSISGQDKYDYLKGCVVKMGNSIKLVENCCCRYKQYIKKNPEWFVANFVQLGGQSSSPDVNSIICIPFWEQIFKDEGKVDSFLSMKDNDNTPYINRARNFWQLFRANEYQPITFEHQGNVQDKINSGLVSEVGQLNELKELYGNVLQLYSQVSANQISKKQIPSKIKSLENKLSKVQLYIRLNGKIREKLNEIKIISAIK